MSVHIHYGGNTYEEVEDDVEKTLDHLTAVLDSDAGRGMLAVTTRTGVVYLSVSSETPIAVEFKKPGPKAQIL